MQHAKLSPSASRVRELFNYDTLTGILTWKSNYHKSKIGKVAGCKYKEGYLTVKFDGKRHQVHRVIWVWMTGENPNGFIDHINHDRSDNRFENLKVVDAKGNQRNKSMQKNNTSGVTGVSWNNKNCKWEAQIYIDNKKINLGQYTKFHEAVNARKNAEVLYGFHENHGKDI